MHVKVGIERHNVIGARDGEVIEEWESDTEQYPLPDEDEDYWEGSERSVLDFGSEADSLPRGANSGRS